MHPETISPETPIVAPKPRPGMIALSALYLLIDLLAFFDHKSPIATFAVICLTCITAFCFYQFGARAFNPARAAAITAALTEPIRDRLRRGSRILLTTTAILALLIASSYFISGRHLFRDWIIYLYPAIGLLPDALADLIGDPPRTNSKATFGPRTEWTNLKPIHSDHWGSGE